MKALATAPNMKNVPVPVSGLETANLTVRKLELGLSGIGPKAVATVAHRS
jgi:hypothetical protein